MTKLNVNLTQETVTDAERIYNVTVEGDTIITEYGLSTSEELNKAEKVIEAGKAGRTVEEEAIVQAWKKVSAKVNKGYEGNYEEFEDVYNEVVEAVQIRKEEVREAKRLEKEQAKEAKRLEREAEREAKRLAEEEAEAEADENEAEVAEADEEAEEKVAVAS